VLKHPSSEPGKCYDEDAVVTAFDDRRAVSAEHHYPFSGSRKFIFNRVNLDGREHTIYSGKYQQNKGMKNSEIMIKKRLSSLPPYLSHIIGISMDKTNNVVCPCQFKNRDFIPQRE
jgi:hypothetical protein